MQDWFNPDFIGALEQNMAPNSAVQAYWQGTLDNLTSGNSGENQAAYPFRIWSYVHCPQLKEPTNFYHIKKKDMVHVPTKILFSCTLFESYLWVISARSCSEKARHEPFCWLAGATYKTYSTSASNRNLYGSVNNVTASLTATSRAQAALGR